MPLALPRFYAIIDRSLRPELSLDETARSLVTAGVRLIQLRAEQATSRALLTEARQLISLLPASVSLLVNDRGDVARFAGAAGVHVGQDDLPVEAARALVGPNKLVGHSTHNLAQLEPAEATSADYIAFGPVFATATKPNHEPVVGLEGLRAARGRTRKPLVAIGGITPANAAEVLEAGADSVAVISAWLVGDIGKNLDAFRRALGALE